MNLLSITISFAIICSSIMLAGNIQSFIDLPSLLLVLGGTFATLFLKFGVDLFSSQIEQVKRDEIGNYGINMSILFGTLGVLIGFIIMLANINDTAAIGPAMGTSVLSFFYSLIISVVFFLPMTKNFQMKSFGFAGVSLFMIFCHFSVFVLHYTRVLGQMS